MDPKNIARVRAGARAARAKAMTKLGPQDMLPGDKAALDFAQGKLGDVDAQAAAPADPSLAQKVGLNQPNGQGLQNPAIPGGAPPQLPAQQVPPVLQPAAPAPAPAPAVQAQAPAQISVVVPKGPQGADTIGSDDVDLLPDEDDEIGFA